MEKEIGLYMNGELMLGYDDPIEAYKAAIEATKELGIPHEVKTIQEGDLKSW